MIDCAPTVELGSPEFMRRFSARTRLEHVPVSGAFDLTYRCNLRCVHCYCGHLTAQSPREAGELGTTAVLRLLDGIAAEGCMYFLLSGGEPLLRRDFVEIYRHACELGMRTGVFTNATLVDDPILEAFREYPPRMVEVSVYGHDAATYERVSGVRGSFERALAGVHRLLDAGVHVGLKTMILRDNVHVVDAIEAMAVELGLRFRIDPLIMPRLDGDAAPLGQRVDPDTAVALELATDERLLSVDALEARQRSAPVRSDLYLCSAGVKAFHIDPRGVVRPCLLSQDLGVDSAGAGFGAAWRSVVQTVASLRRRADSQCIECSLKAVCGYCPGFFALETGSPHEVSPYLCALAERRSGMIAQAREARREHECSWE